MLSTNADGCNASFLADNIPAQNPFGPGRTMMVWTMMPCTELEVQGVPLLQNACDFVLSYYQICAWAEAAQGMRRQDTAQRSAAFHSVVSDMCHNTIGNASADSARSLNLAWHAARIALTDAPPEATPDELSESCCFSTESNVLDMCHSMCHSTIGDASADSACLQICMACSQGSTDGCAA